MINTSKYIIPTSSYTNYTILKINKIVYLTYFYYETVELPGGNTNVLDCIEVKCNLKITATNPIKVV